MLPFLILYFTKISTTSASQDINYFYSTISSQIINLQMRYEADGSNRDFNLHVYTSHGINSEELIFYESIVARSSNLNENIYGFNFHYRKAQDGKNKITNLQRELILTCKKFNAYLEGNSFFYDHSLYYNYESIIPYEYTNTTELKTINDFKNLSSCFHFFKFNGENCTDIWGRIKQTVLLQKDDVLSVTVLSSCSLSNDMIVGISRILFTKLKIKNKRTNIFILISKNSTENEYYRQNLTDENINIDSNDLRRAITLINYNSYVINVSENDTLKNYNIKNYYLRGTDNTIISNEFPVIKNVKYISVYNIIMDVYLGIQKTNNNTRLIYFILNNHLTVQKFYICLKFDLYNTDFKLTEVIRFRYLEEDVIFDKELPFLPEIFISNILSLLKYKNIGKRIPFRNIKTFYSEFPFLMFGSSFVYEFPCSDIDLKELYYKLKMKYGLTLYAGYFAKKFDSVSVKIKTYECNETFFEDANVNELDIRFQESISDLRLKKNKELLNYPTNNIFVSTQNVVRSLPMIFKITFKTENKSFLIWLNYENKMVKIKIVGEDLYYDYSIARVVSDIYSIVTNDADEDIYEKLKEKIKYYDHLFDNFE